MLLLKRQYGNQRYVINVPKSNKIGQKATESGKKDAPNALKFISVPATSTQTTSAFALQRNNLRAADGKENVIRYSSSAHINFT